MNNFKFPRNLYELNYLLKRVTLRQWLAIGSVMLSALVIVLMAVILIDSTNTKSLEPKPFSVAIGQPIVVNAKVSGGVPVKGTPPSNTRGTLVFTGLDKITGIAVIKLIVTATSQEYYYYLAPWETLPVERVNTPQYLVIDGVSYLVTIQATGTVVANCQTITVGPNVVETCGHVMVLTPVKNAVANYQSLPTVETR